MLECFSYLPIKFSYVFCLGGQLSISCHSGNKTLKPGLNAIHRQSPNNRSGWRNRGGGRRRACTQKTSSGWLIKDISWVGGWVESPESLSCCEGAPPPSCSPQCRANASNSPTDLTCSDRRRGECACVGVGGWGGGGVTQSQLIISTNCCL